MAMPPLIEIAQGSQPIENLNKVIDLEVGLSIKLEARFGRSVLEKLQHPAVVRGYPASWITNFFMEIQQRIQ
jgi:hypothetical protein